MNEVLKPSLDQKVEDKKISKKSTGAKAFLAAGFLALNTSGSVLASQATYNNPEIQAHQQIQAEQSQVRQNEGNNLAEVLIGFGIVGLPLLIAGVTKRQIEKGGPSRFM